MTAQMSDRFILDKIDYSLVGLKGTGMFDPGDHGLIPIGTCSACWRGFSCTYRLKNKLLLLDTLDVNHSSDESNRQLVAGPIINGVKPEQTPGFFNNSYRSLNLVIHFNGGLLLGDGFISELYVHMGFHPAWKYKKVIELIFDDGQLVERNDVSERMAELREKLRRQPLKPSIADDPEEFQAWIRKTFKLEYPLDEY